MRKLLPVVVLSLSVLSVVQTAAAADANPAASAPAAPSYDYSTPANSVKALLDAVKAKDSPAVRNSLYIDDKHKESADVLLAAIDASIHLQKAMATKFGKAGVDAMQGPGGADSMLTTRFKAIADAPVTITGDTAVMQLEDEQAAKAPGGGKIAFRKVDDKWRVDMGSILNIDDPQIRESLPLMSKLGDAMEATAKDVDDRKLLTVQDTVQTLRTRVIAIAQAARAAAGPAPGATTSSPGATPGK